MGEKGEPREEHAIDAHVTKDEAIARSDSAVLKDCDSEDVAWGGLVGGCTG